MAPAANDNTKRAKVQKAAAQPTALGMEAQASASHQALGLEPRPSTSREELITTATIINTEPRADVPMYEAGPLYKGGPKLTAAGARRYMWLVRQYSAGHVSRPPILGEDLAAFPFQPVSSNALAGRQPPPPPARQPSLTQLKRLMANGRENTIPELELGQRPPTPPALPVASWRRPPTPPAPPPSPATAGTPHSLTNTLTSAGKYGLKKKI
jgi:hypothetical protein